MSEVFVTVGTTEFEPLVDAMISPEIVSVFNEYISIMRLTIHARSLPFCLVLTTSRFF